MARADWFDDKKDVPVIDEQMNKLEEQSSVVKAMKAVEADLDDSQHAKVTRLLMELSAYNVMRLLHELQQKRLERFTSR